jgi:hypothetical protein
MQIATLNGNLERLQSQSLSIFTSYSQTSILERYEKLDKMAEETLKNVQIIEKKTD